VIQVGDVLREKYRLESSIGKGGMGEVFSSVDLVSQRRVAVKVVSRNIIGDLLMARLQREAVAAVRVRSDHVPQILDVDTTEEGELFLVMELLRGQTLAERLKQRGHLTWEEVSRIGEDVLRGLHDAHAAGVIHRDLKPSNIFVQLAKPGGFERAKILDFGVCKLDAPDGEKLTTTGESVGTVAYMAPEQIRGASKVDQRADIYSFATVVFEALSGRLAHDANGQMAMLASKLERPALRLADVALEPLPPGLDPLIAQSLARNPDERMGTAADLLQAWLALGPATLEPRTLPVMTLLPDGQPGLQHATQTNLTAGTMTRVGRKSAKVHVLVAVGAMAMAVGVLGAMMSVRATAHTSVPDPAPVDSFAAAVVPPPGEQPVTDDPRNIPGPVLPVVPPVDRTIELSADGGVPGVRPPRVVRTRPARPVIGTKRGAGEPRIDDKPRY
jgi:serine/threonine protein kinase